MVKIIRCASKNEIAADFTSYFNEQIEIKKGSKIALESMSVNLQLSGLITIPANFNWYVQNAIEDPERLCSIKAANYTKDSLLSNLQNTLNTTCNWRTDISGINTEYKPFIDDNNKLNIQWLTNVQDSGSKLLTLSLYDDAIYNVVQGDIAEDDIITITEIPDEITQNIVTKEIASLNSGGISCRLLGNTTAGNQITGFVLALVKSPLAGQITDVSITNPYVFCGLLVKDTGEIEIWSSGNKKTPVQVINAQTGAGANNYTDFRIYKEGQNISIYVQRQDMPNAVQLIKLTEKIDANNIKVFGFVSFQEANTSITKLNYLASPYINSNSTGVSIIDYNYQKQDTENYITYNDVGQPAILPSLHTITFSDIVKILFGYKQNVYSQDANQGVFIGENPVVGLYYADNIIVEVPSLGLECYDSSTTGRRNILKFVPNDKENTSHKKEYVSQFPVYINIRNNTDTFINSIQVRFLDTQGIPLQIIPGAGSCEAILIIED